MNKFLKIGVIAVLAQAAFAGAAAAQTARPVAVDIMVGELSDASGAISAAAASGSDREAERLLAELFSGRVTAVKSEPVYAAKCCCPGAAVPQETSGVAVSTPTATVTPAAPAQAPETYAERMARLKMEKEAKAKKDADEAKEKADKQKQFNWGLTILTVALLLLFLL